jgi:hypothetical protein
MEREELTSSLEEGYKVRRDEGSRSPKNSRHSTWRDGMSIRREKHTCCWIGDWKEFQNPTGRCGIE